MVPTCSTPIMPLSVGRLISPAEYWGGGIRGRGGVDRSPEMTGVRWAQRPATRSGACNLVANGRADEYLHSVLLLQKSSFQKNVGS